MHQQDILKKGLHQQDILKKGLLGAAACCCCFVILIIIMYIVMALLYSRRDPRPDDIDFGTSRFDHLCNWTFRSKRFVPAEKNMVPRRTYPYIGLVYYRKALFLPLEVCTASIIDQRHLLIAAHCVSNHSRKLVGSWYSDFVNNTQVDVIRLGDLTSPNFQSVSAEDIYIHSDFDVIGEGTNDMAVIRVDQNIMFNNYSQPVCLAGVKDQLPSNKECVSFGYFSSGSGPDQTANIYRAPNIKIHKADECSMGELGVKSSDHIKATLVPNKTLTPIKDVALTNTLRNYLHVFFRGKFCSEASDGEPATCQGDTGGLLMCTPDGVSVKSPNYHKPSSPEFSQTDPTLKQFAINMKDLKGKRCGEAAFVSLYSSVKAHRLWLEYVAWPLLQNAATYKQKEKERFDKCMDNMDWDTFHYLAREFDVTITHLHQYHICRKFVAYVFCSEFAPKDNVKHCDHTYLTVLEGLQVSALYIDLLEIFQQRRCKHYDICAAGRLAPLTIFWLIMIQVVVRVI